MPNPDSFRRPMIHRPAGTGPSSPLPSTGGGGGTIDLPGNAKGMAHILIVSSSEPQWVQDKADFVVPSTGAGAALQGIFNSFAGGTVWMAGVFYLESDVTINNPGTIIRGLGSFTGVTQAPGGPGGDPGTPGTPVVPPTEPGDPGIPNPDPPEPGEPPVAPLPGSNACSFSVNESYPASPHVVLNPGQSLASHIGTANRIIELEPGNYGNQRINGVANGVHIFCKTPKAARFDSGGFPSPPFVNSGGSNVTLQGLHIDRYGPQPTGTGGGATAAVIPGGNNWVLIDCLITRAVGSGISLAKSGHRLLRVEIAHCGQYGWNGGTNVRMKDMYVHHIVTGGSGNPPQYEGSSDRGLCKMAASTGVCIDGLIAHNLGNSSKSAKGLWWDGSRDGRAYRVQIDNVWHNGISIELCWGGTKVAPPGKTVTWPDYAFIIDGFSITNQNHGVHSSSGWPAPAGVSINQTAGVLIRNGTVNGAPNGITSAYNYSHPGISTRGMPGQNIPVEWTRVYMGLYNTRVENCTIRNTKRYTAGYNADSGPGNAIPWTPGIVFRNNTYPTGGTGHGGQPNPRFRNGSNDSMSLAQWQASGQG